MANFDRYSNKSDSAPFDGVIFGANSTILEVELNEMQQIQDKKISDALSIFGDCVFDRSGFTYENGTLTINTKIIKDGIIINAIGATIDVADGDSVYLSVEQVEYTKDSEIHYNGNISGDIIENTILDDRCPNETTRRKGHIFTLSTTDESGMIIGKVVNGEFSCVANIPTSHNNDYVFDTLKEAEDAVKAGLIEEGANVYVKEDSDSIYKMTGATADKDGRGGIVPVPKAGQENNILNGDGIWKSPLENEIIATKVEELEESINSSLELVHKYYTKYEGTEENPLDVLTLPPGHWIINTIDHHAINMPDDIPTGVFYVDVYRYDHMYYVIKLMPNQNYKFYYEYKHVYDMNSGWVKYASASELSNPNLLINPNFRINQRGGSEYQTIGGFTVDRWRHIGRETTIITPQETSLHIKDTSGLDTNLIEQVFDDFSVLAGKTVTLSVSFSNKTGDMMQFGVFLENGAVATVRAYEETREGVLSVTGIIPSDITRLSVGCTKYGTSTNFSVDINWFKLELGSVATPFVPPDPATELVKCQRYYETGIQFSNPNAVIWNQHDFIPFKANKRVPATVKVYNVSTLAENEVCFYHPDSGYTVANPAWIAGYHDGFRLSTATPNANIKFYNIDFRWSADAEIR